MSNKADFQNFFPVDNSSLTNLHYDLVASKFMTGIENHKRTQYNNSASNSAVFPLIGAIIQIIFGLVIAILGILKFIFKSLR
ncbi:hypothetical protein [Flavobacterium saliperosum]|uniref:Uncharacterized protein n=2 Tax=Flavobacterium saliperosum TaxID=329186 RepID=A0A1G4V525_9FLAO|nr:hypothetical protein [Flavobacterium saliperosum]SCX01332.1 hypothetical protein SAMN02927925_00311 [Flavobacterium saliperosum]